MLTDSPVDVTDPELQERVGELCFYSATYRLFRVANAEAGREDYGQEAVYRGTIPEYPAEFRLDKDSLFRAGEPTPVCGNTYRLLKSSRFSVHFELIGDNSHHLGAFGSTIGDFPFSKAAPKAGNDSCC